MSIHVHSLSGAWSTLPYLTCIGDAEHSVVQGEKHLAASLRVCVNVLDNISCTVCC